MVAEEKFGVDVHILDDGFQHLALARDVDIVLLDATQELLHYTLLPAGRLREPFSALTRAHFVVITRTELADSEPLEEQVRQINPQAKIFRCATKLLAFRDAASGDLVSLSAVGDKMVSAFCGIGNPEAFFGDLGKWGFSVKAKKEFPDHCRYEGLDLVELGMMIEEENARPLLTTEKDALNLQKSMKPARGAQTSSAIFACVIQLEMTEAEAFEEAMLEHLKAAKVNA